MVQVLGVIPARYQSSRFPGKPLVMIGNQSMIQRVYNQAKKALKNVVVATDDERIFAHVKKFGGEVVITSVQHKSGTDRCCEAANIFKKENPNINFDVVINIQGDEPFIEPMQISDLAECFSSENVEIATIIRKENNIEKIKNHNIVKVIKKINNDAIYFSRNIIPYVRDEKIENWTEKHNYYVHVGIYAYKFEILNKIVKLNQSELEISESLEQNRWLENNFKIKTILTEFENIGIDTHDDLQTVLNSKKIKIL